MFPVVPHAAPGPGALGVALFVGVLLGLGSTLLTTFVYACEDFFQRMLVHWMWWPAIGAVVVGLGGLIDPRVLGVGYETIHSLMRGEILGGALIGLLIAKAVVWSVALGSGTSGGVLAPLLMMGGAMGAWLGQWMPAGDPQLWAMAGMGAMMAGMMNLPFTGMIFTLELSHDLNTLPVLLVSCTAAFGTAVLLLRRSILTEKLARRGHHVAREYSVDSLELTRVAEVMEREVPAVPESTTVAELSEMIAKGDPVLTRRQGTFILDVEQKLAGIITRGDLLRALQQNPDGSKSVLQAGNRDVIVTFPDALLREAMRKMLKHNIGRLPVVKRVHPDTVIGYLGRSCILAARLREHQEEEVRERAMRMNSGSRVGS